MDLSDTRAVITGAGRGLGKGFAESLLQHGAAKVCLIDQDVAAGTQTYKDLIAKFSQDRVLFYAVDVTNHQKFKEAFNSAVSSFGHVNLMVNNAGVVDESKHDLEIDVNYKALVFGTYLSLEHMRRDKGGRGGRVINVSSIAGLVDYFHAPVYCGTKQAIRAFTCSLAAQPKVQDLGVEFAVLCPDATDTEMLQNLDDSKMHYLELARETCRDITMQVPTVVEAFLELYQRPHMNGSILQVESCSRTYRRMDNHHKQ